MGEIFIVGIIGFVCNTILFCLPGARAALRHAIANKEFATLITIVFVLLTWPTGARDAFGEGASLGVAG